MKLLVLVYDDIMVYTTHEYSFHNLLFCFMALGRVLFPAFV